MTRAKYSLTSSSVIGCLVSLFKISARVHPVNAFAPKDGQQKIAFAHLIMFEISAVLRNRYFPISIFKQPPSKRARQNLFSNRSKSFASEPAEVCRKTRRSALL